MSWGFINIAGHTIDLAGHDLEQIELDLARAVYEVKLMSGEKPALDLLEMIPVSKGVTREYPEYLKGDQWNRVALNNLNNEELEAMYRKCIKI